MQRNRNRRQARRSGRRSLYGFHCRPIATGLICSCSARMGMVEMRGVFSQSLLEGGTPGKKVEKGARFLTTMTIFPATGICEVSPVADGKFGVFRSARLGNYSGCRTTRIHAASFAGEFCSGCQQGSGSFGLCKSRWLAGILHPSPTAVYRGGVSPEKQMVKSCENDSIPLAELSKRNNLKAFSDLNGPFDGKVDKFSIDGIFFRRNDPSAQVRYGVETGRRSWSLKWQPGNTARLRQPAEDRTGNVLDEWESDISAGSQLLHRFQ